jgi:hypothetical protein
MIKSKKVEVGEAYSTHRGCKARRILVEKPEGEGKRSLGRPRRSLYERIILKCTSRKEWKEVD